MTTKKVLMRALEKFGPEGQNWVNDSPVSKTQRCMISGLVQLNGTGKVIIHPGALAALKNSIDTKLNLVEWNKTTTWFKVREVYEKAIAASA